MLLRLFWSRVCVRRRRSPRRFRVGGFWLWLRGQDLNLRPSGYEPDELPGCSTPRHLRFGGAKGDRLAGAGGSDRVIVGSEWGGVSAFGRPGGDRLSRVLRQSTIGAKVFDGRVRDGIGSCHLAKATRPAKRRKQ